MLQLLNPERHQNHITGSKVTAILLNVWILPIGGASSVKGLRLQPAQQACCFCQTLNLAPFLFHDPNTAPYLFLVIDTAPILFPAPDTVAFLSLTPHTTPFLCLYPFKLP